jgi:hypothetical protein
MHCLPDELLARASSRELAELQAYYALKEKRRAREEKEQREMQRRYESSKNKGMKSKQAPPQ